MCQIFLDFSNQIVRHDNSSVHVQGCNEPSTSFRIQIRLSDRQHVRFLFADYCEVRQQKLYLWWNILTNLSEWCHKSRRKSDQCPIRISLNDDRHAAFIHASNCITLRTDLVHKVEILEIAYGKSWKSRKRSSMRIGVEVKLYLPKISEMIYMTYITSRKRRDAIGPPNLSLR